MKSQVQYTIGVFLLVFVAWFFTGCEKAEEASTPPVVLKDLSWNNKEWSKFVQTKISEEYLETLDQAKDISQFCPKYAARSKEERVHAWGEVISAMAKFESNWKANKDFKECSKTCIYGSCQKVGELFCMKDGHALDGGLVISRGLLQISLKSAQGYKCPAKKPTDLHDAELNLDCSLKIITHRIKKTGTFHGSASQYWSVLKPGTKWGKVPEIQAMVKKVCP